MTDENDLTDPHGEVEALRRENARLKVKLDRREKLLDSVIWESTHYRKRAEAAEATLAAIEYYLGSITPPASTREAGRNASGAYILYEDGSALIKVNSGAQCSPIKIPVHLAASRAPDPVVNAGSCRPMNTIDSLFDQIRAIMDAAKDQADRYGHIAATIHVNALRNGATSADADAMVRGEINFISWMADVIEKRDRAHPPMQPTIGGAELDALLDAAKSEAAKAMRKFPQPNYVISKVAEEAGEVVKAAIHCAEGRETQGAVLNEIRQALAMLIRLAVEGDQVHGLPALLTPDAITALRAQPAEHRADADLRALLARVPSALNSAFGAGIEEREGGSARRQAKLMEPVDKLRDDIRAALSDLAKMKGE